MGKNKLTEEQLRYANKYGFYGSMGAEVYEQLYLNLIKENGAKE